MVQRGRSKSRSSGAGRGRSDGVGRGLPLALRFASAVGGQDHPAWRALAALS